MKRTSSCLLLGAAVLLAPPGRAQPAAPPPSQAGSAFFDWGALTPVPTPVGLYRRVIDAPTPTLRRLEVHVTTLRPGFISHPPHHHPQEELVLLKDGVLESSINGRKRTVGPGSLLFFASHDVHNVRNVGKTPATYYVINFYTAATFTVPNRRAADWAPPGTQPSAAIDWNDLVSKATADGVRRSLIDAPTLTFKRLEIHATTLDPGRPASRPHRHPWPMLLVVTEGRLEARIDGVTGVVGPGSLIFIAADALQSVRNPGGGPATYFVFSVSSAEVRGS